MLVQDWIDRGRDNRHIRMRALHFGNTRWTSEDTHQLQPSCASLLNDRDGFDRAMTCRKHWVQDQHLGIGQIRREAAKIFYWSQCSRIAVKADVTGSRFGD